MSDVVGDFLLGLRLGFAGEHFAALDSLFIKIPDDALPTAISTSEHVAVCSESFLRHSWQFFLSGVFFNYQHYRTAFAYVQTYVLRFVEKNRPAFWWIYTCLGRGVFTDLFFVYCNAIFEVGAALLNAEEKKRISKRGFGA